MTFLAIEEWKDVAGYEGFYEVSSFGRVKSKERTEMCMGGIRHRSERILKQNSTRKDNKHCLVVLCRDGTTKPFLVHRLVAAAFIPNPENKPYIDHIDTDPTNNHVWNLRWVTQKENALNPLTREHISKSKMGHPYWGRPLTDEERKKISDANRGRKLSEETKKKLSEAHKRLAKKRMEENRYETE